ncbi:hypothetical protein [Deinococcus cellulosilyticus]|uniref:Uncharacterized protein n=1 Tax=Deinococcus cellulosilyticus (strain DSM 18568 / NBRC 106333 / KACC 11606 / 5516J-15) TaxID=1223518 RepID=A0A511N4J5_DEIC1|nr:hypothetical protein [Deinococcus cellulosilyticus]GEM47397.1 hypothetical protein DC3_30320 [Deinococcus cellulosilyticus NBRC 106333 = KACC 11606]
MRWLELYDVTDSHPRLFDSPETAVRYLRVHERLAPEQQQYVLDTLSQQNRCELNPPVTRKSYVLKFKE